MAFLPWGGGVILCMISIVSYVMLFFFVVGLGHSLFHFSMGLAPVFMLGLIGGVFQVVLNEECCGISGVSCGVVFWGPFVEVFVW